MAPRPGWIAWAQRTGTGEVKAESPPNIGYLSPIRVNQPVELAFWRASARPFELTGEYPLYGRTGPHRAEPALYVCRARFAAPDHRAARRAAYADRHLSGHSHPRDRRGLAVPRAAAGSDVGPHRHAVRAGADDDGQRYRAYRLQFLQRLWHRQDILPAERRYPHRQRPGHRDLADADQGDAAGRHAAPDPQLLCLHRADHPGRPVRRRAYRTEPRRYRHQPVAQTLT